MPELMHPLAASFRFDGDEPDAFLMLHGWTGTPAHFRLAARFVNERGYAVSAPLLEGHGTAVHHMMATGWRDWVRSALQGLHELAADYERIHVVGLSMGGLIGLLLSATCEVDSITTINAPQRLWSRAAWISRFMRGSVRLREGDPRAAPPGETAEFWVQYEHSPVGTAGDLLDLIDAANAVLPNIAVPAIVIQSRADETVRPESASIICERLGSAEKRIVWLQRSRHVALLDQERDLIHQEIMTQVRTS